MSDFNVDFAELSRRMEVLRGANGANRMAALHDVLEEAAALVEAVENARQSAIDAVRSDLDEVMELIKLWVLEEHSL